MCAGCVPAANRDSALSSDPIIQRRPRKPFDWSTAFIAVVVVSAAVVVYARDGRARFLEIDQRCPVVPRILPKVLAACLIATFVTVLMPRETVLRWVGGELGHRRPHHRDARRRHRARRADHRVPDRRRLRRDRRRIGATIAFVTSWTLLGLWPRAGLGAAVLRPGVRDLAQPRGAAAADRGRPAGALHRARDSAAAGTRRMIFLVDAFLWTIALALAVVAGRRSPTLLRRARARACSISSG